MIRAFGEGVMLLWGWRRLAAAFGAGAVAALSMPPLSLVSALFIAMPVAVWLIDGTPGGRSRRSPRAILSAATLGWWFGWGYFIAGLWWLGAAFVVESDEFLWLMPFGVLGLPAVLAVFHALAFALARLFWSTGARRIFALAAAFGAADWLRGQVLTGFPWNSFGQAFSATDVSLQAASIFGLHGLSVLAVLIAAAPAPLATGRRPVERFLAPAIGALLLIAIAGFGAQRLLLASTDTVADVRLRIMQPNISQRDKNGRMSAQAVLSRYLALSDRATGPATAGIAGVTHLIWPESPFPFLLAREPQALSQIAALLKGQTILITGAARAEDPPPGQGARRFFNAIHVVEGNGTIAASYDKVHLVPFGEYLPFRDLLTALGLRQFVEVPGGFEAGARRTPLMVPGLPAPLPLICYEAIFPDAVRAARADVGLLLNVTNDGWFGATFGPYQHLAQARMRAVELGLPLVRAANTGISVITDSYGQIIRRLDLGIEGVIDSPLPRAQTWTIYASYGQELFILILLLCNGVAAGALRRA
jgi:apolipoprotein N-acyltransferase